MSDPENSNILRIILLHTIDGQELEAFITKRRLRSGGDEVYEPERLGDFQPGTRYGLVVVASSSPTEVEKTANEIAAKFEGMVY